MEGEAAWRLPEKENLEGNRVWEMGNRKWGLGNQAKEVETDNVLVKPRSDIRYSHVQCREARRRGEARHRQ